MYNTDSKVEGVDCYILNTSNGRWLRLKIWLRQLYANYCQQTSNTCRSVQRCFWAQYLAPWCLVSFWIRDRDAEEVSCILSASSLIISSRTGAQHIKQQHRLMWALRYLSDLQVGVSAVLSLTASISFRRILAEQSLAVELPASMFWHLHRLLAVDTAEQDVKEDSHQPHGKPYG